MCAIALRELKNRLSEYLRALKRGAARLVTDRGQVVAEIHRPDAYPPQPRLGPDGTAARVLDELRREQ